MLCDDCKKREATFHSIKKINGVSTEKHLCSDCQKKYGFQMMKLSNMGDLFSNFTNLLNYPQEEEQVCPECGTASDDFLNTGYVGCSNCYKEFSKIMYPVIQKMQNSLQHVGKSPVGLDTSPSTEYDKLAAELKKAISEENYEQATILRDKMRMLKGGN